MSFAATTQSECPQSQPFAQMCMRTPPAARFRQVEEASNKKDSAWRPAANRRAHHHAGRKKLLVECGAVTQKAAAINSMSMFAKVRRRDRRRFLWNCSATSTSPLPFASNPDLGSRHIGETFDLHIVGGQRASEQAGKLRRGHAVGSALSNTVDGYPDLAAKWVAASRAMECAPQAFRRRSAELKLMAEGGGHHPWLPGSLSFRRCVFLSGFLHNKTVLRGTGHVNKKTQNMMPTPASDVPNECLERTRTGRTALALVYHR